MNQLDMSSITNIIRNPQHFIEDLQEEMIQLRKNLADQDKKIIKTLEGKGVIPS